MKFIVFNSNKNPERYEGISPVEISTEEVANWMIKVIDISINKDININLRGIADLPIPNDDPEYSIKVGQKYLYQTLGLTPGELIGNNRLAQAKIMGIFEHFFYIHPVITIEDPFNTTPLVSEIGKIISVQAKV